LICQHLTAAPEEYHLWFTGVGVDCHFVCPDCAGRYPELPTELVEATDALIDHCKSEASWQGICGRPEIKQRLTSLRFTHQSCSLRFPQDSRLIDIQPSVNTPGSWVALLSSGNLALLNPRGGDLEVLFPLTYLSFEIDQETALCLSPKQDYVAVYQVSNQDACVFDLRTGAISARTNRGTYRPENSHYPIAFFEREGRSLLVVATDWNRLDIIDPGSGELLTERAPTCYRKGEERPPHYLDYFHARLSVSPENNWIADSGWVWQPWGSVRSWNLGRWLKENPWEPEDGLSLRKLAGRAYYWDGPVCWIDDSTLAIWGWGEDDEWLIPAIRLLDVQDGQEIGWFAGPEARRPRAWPPKKLAPSLFFDQYLFSVHDEHGIGVWDIETGERLAQDASFAPINYHPASKEFLSSTADGITLSKLAIA
jgi:hypothetical protein